MRLNLFKGIKSSGHGLLRSIGWTWVAMFAIAIFATSVANGQLTGKGAINGTVTDNTGAVIAGADVSAKNEATGIRVSVKSTGAGDFNFPALDPGIYTVTTAAKGFETQAQQNIHVNAMEQEVYNPSLTVGAASVEITVTTEPPQLETSTAVLGATMENETYSELPIEMGAYGSADQRRATDFVYLMPGVQGNETNGNATTNTGVVNGSGSKGAVSAVYIDGLPFVRAGGNGDPRYVWTAISVDAIDQFQLQTTGYSSVYEGQGVMNYSIKQGGQKYHAAVYEFFRNTALDSYGWFGHAPNSALASPAHPFGVPVKPVEHSNEYGINVSGPLLPFGSLKNKLFYFGNYNGFRYTNATPTPMTFPTPLEQSGDFSGVLDSNGKMIPIYDPLSQTACTAHSNNGICRYAFGYGPPPAGTANGANGVPTLIGAGHPLNVILPSEFSPISSAMQALLPQQGIGTAIGNNYVAPTPSGLVNWSMTHRLDYVIGSSDTLSMVAAIGRQASSVPVGQSTAGRNNGPVPFNFGQAFAPKTAVGVIEETHTFSANLLNQIKWGYARYFGPTFNPDTAPAYAATKMGISGLPSGQAQGTFPILAFPAGTPGAWTNWGGTTSNNTTAENYTVLDNLQWTVGKHSFTFGGQIAWLLYNVNNATGGGSSPITLTEAVTETAGFNKSGSTTVLPGSGLAYASFLIGEHDKGSFTQYLQQEFGARFRAVSPYVQDNWKVTPKLTLDLGVRYDYFPTLTEVHNAESYFDPNTPNPVTGINGALVFTGNGPNTCNCATPVKNYYKNWGPRVGVAYQLGSKTVIRSSYGVMFTHGDAVGGLATSLGTLGFSAAPTFSSSLDLSTMPGLVVTDANTPGSGTGAIPIYAGAAGSASGPAFGTGNISATSPTNPTGVYTGTPSSMGYIDPYLGSRAPEYINWSFGIQRQLTNAMTLTATYVGSEGHFLQTDSLTGRGFFSNQLSPSYLYLTTHLSDTSKTATTPAQDCVTYNLPCPSMTTFNQSAQTLSTALKPFPYQTVPDSFAYIGNANYHGLQALLSMRAWHGLTLSTNFSFSRAIDDGGSFRTGYAIPAGTLANHPSTSYKADAIERTVSTSNQPKHFVVTGVWDVPFGKTVLNGNLTERAILGGFKFSTIFQAFSGSPLAITEGTCQTNPAQSSTCPAIMNPNFSGKARQGGKWGKGVSSDPLAANNFQKVSFVVPSTGTTTATAQGPFMNPVSTVLSSYAYQFSDAPRTAPYNLYGPGNYQLDLSLNRSFPLHFSESAKLNFRAEMYNVTNHTLFAVASAAVGNSLFGTVTQSPIANRKAAQFEARISF